MTVVYAYGGPTKRAIIDRAYGFCGLSTAEYELSPEEYVAGLRAFNDQMALLPNAKVNLPTYGDGSPQDESGLDNADTLGAAVLVAQLLGPQIGKQVQTNASQARAADILLAKYQTTPSMGYGRNTIRGTGNRWRGFTPFLPTDVVVPIVQIVTPPPTPTPTPTPTLGLLSLSTPLQIGVATSGTIDGYTAGSTITTTIPGITITGTNYSGTPTASGSFALVETLAGANGSPYSSPISVTAAGYMPSLDFSNASNSGYVALLAA